ncbi:aromatic amino acid exporter YddG [Desertibaculum subflavum]|uniref:aromatic amino acid exporter YddG n=1 Tax=Desertibaculum subflavum TaxID=2268458 RepID=UPI0013C3F0D2
MSRTLATAIGMAAILLWSSLALLTTGARAVPPFLLTGVTFGVAFLIALGLWAARGQNPLNRLRLPLQVWLVGIGGLFGYHFLYFLALRLAPPVEANLINYLWPLLIVLFSALLPGERLRWFHLAGAGLGLAGTVLIVTGGEIRLRAEHAAGYVAALGCAATWAAYSVRSRVYAEIPSDAIGGFCGATAILAFTCHLVLEPAGWPADAATWATVVALGLGPVGAAFFLWDHGVKRGDIKALGALAYLTPLLSTGLLVAFGRAETSPTLAAATALIVGGGALGAGGLYRRRVAAPEPA